MNGKHAVNDELEQGRIMGEDMRPLPHVIKSELIYSGKVITLHRDEILLSEDHTAIREVVEHPGAVVVLAIDESGEVLLVSQYRHAIGGWLLELPAGGLEPGEEPLQAAKRELREEVGIEARNWTHLGSFYSTPGFVNERLHAYLAQGLTGVETDPDDDEDISVIRYPLQQLLDHLEEVPDAKTLATLCLFHRSAFWDQTDAT